MADTNPFVDPKFGEDQAQANPFADPNFGKPRSLIGSFGAGAGETAVGFTRAAGNVLGLPKLEEWSKKKAEGFAATPDEAGSIAHGVARGLGGLTAALPAIVGTTMLLPEAAAGAGMATLAARGAIAMTPVAASAGINTTADLKLAGVDDSTANTAGLAKAATTAAMGVVPLSMTGNLVKRAVTGAAAGMATGEVERQVQNSLLDKHPDQQSQLDHVSIITNAVVGGALAAVMGPRPIKTAVNKALKDAEADMAAGGPLERPEFKLEPSGEVAQPRPEFELEQQEVPPGQGELDLRSRAPEVNPQQLELSAPEVPPTPPAPTRVELQGIAETADLGVVIPKQVFAKVTKDVETVAEVVTKLQVEAESAKNKDTKNAILDLADRLTPKETPSAQEATQAIAPEAQPKEAAGPAAPTIASTKQMRGTGETHITLSTGEVIKLYKDNATGSMGLPGWHWSSDRKEVAPSQPGHVSSYLADTKAEALKELEKKLPQILALKEHKNAVPIEGPAGEVPRAVVAGGDLTQGGEGVRPGEQGQEAAGARAVEGNGEIPAAESPYAKVARLQEETKAKQAGTPAEEIVTPEVSAAEEQSARKVEIDGLIKKAQDAQARGDFDAMDAYAHQAMAKVVEGGDEYKQYLQDEKTNKAGEAFASETEKPVVRPSSEGEVRAAAQELLGSREAVDSTITFVTDPEAQIPARAFREIKAEEEKTGKLTTVAFAYDGKMYVFADRIEAGQERAVILHEVGGHLGMEKLIGKDNFDSLVNQIQEWANGNGGAAEIAIAQKTMESIRAAKLHEGHIDQETVAYFIQHAVEAGFEPGAKLKSQNLVAQWLNKLWEGMKRAVQKLGLDPSQLTAQEVVDLAHSAAVAYAEGIPGAGKETIDFKSSVLRSATATHEEKFQAGPAGAMQSAKDTLGALGRVADKIPLPEGAGQWMQQKVMTLSSLGHLKQVYHDILPKIHGAYNPIEGLVGAWDSVSARVTERNHATQQIFNKVQNTLDRKQIKQLAYLAGESTRLGVRVDLPFEKQTAAAIKQNMELAKRRGEPITQEEATTATRGEYDKLKAIYNSPGMKDLYEGMREHNGENYDREHAAIIRNLGKYAGVPEDIWAKIDPTKGRSAEVKAVEEWIAKNGTDEYQRAIKEAQTSHGQIRGKPYFHLGRDGDYFARFDIKANPEAQAAVRAALEMTSLPEKTIISPDESHVFVRMQKIGEFKALEAQLAQLHKDGHLEDTLQTGALQEQIRQLDSSSPTFIRSLLNSIAADTRLSDDTSVGGMSERQQMMNTIRRMAVEMMPETSASKAFAKRKGVTGYDADVMLNFIKRANASSYFVAHTGIQPEVATAMQRMREGVNALQTPASGVYDSAKSLTASNLEAELRLRHANMLNPIHSPALDTASAFGYTYLLSNNPAFILSNLVQPWQMSLPEVGARHGFMKATKEMFNSSSLAWSIIKDTIQEGWAGDGGNNWRGILDANISIDRSKGTAADKGFLKDLVASGQAEWTQAHDNARIIEGKSEGIRTAAKLGSVLQHYSEAANRMTAGLTAFRLEMAKNGGDAKAASAYAIQHVKNTQLDYSAHDKASAFTKHGMFGKVTPLATGFMQFQMKTLELLSRYAMRSFDKAPSEQRAEARKAMAGILATTTMAAGSLGLPLASLVAAAYNNFAGDEDHQVDFTLDHRNWLADTFGADVGEVIAHGGLSALTGANFSSHLGMENLMPGSQFLLDRRAFKDKAGAGALSLGGPSVGAAKGALQGAMKIYDGDVMEGLKEGLPASLRGFAKAADLSENGFTNAKGEKLPMDATSWDTFVQSLNFTPVKKAEQSEAQRGVNTVERLIQARKKAIESSFVDAYEAKDATGKRDALAEITSFNKANPDYAIKNLSGILKRRLMDEQIAGITGVVSRAKQIPRTQEEARFLGRGANQ